VRSLRIGQRLAAGFGLVVALALVIGGIGLRTTSRLDEQLRVVTRDRFALVTLTNDILERSVDNARITMQLFLVSGGQAEEALLAQNQENSAAITAGMAKIEALLATEKDKALFADVQALRGPYLDSRAQAKKLLESGKRDAAAAVAHDVMVPKLAEYRAAWSRFLASQNEAMVRDTETGAARVKTARIFTGIGVGFAALLAFFVGWALERSITGPLETAVLRAERIAAGDFREDADEGVHRDEPGRLEAAMREMLARLLQAGTGRRRHLDLRLQHLGHDAVAEFFKGEGEKLLFDAAHRPARLGVEHEIFLFHADRVHARNNPPGYDPVPRRYCDAKMAGAEDASAVSRPACRNARC